MSSSHVLAFLVLGILLFSGGFVSLAHERVSSVLAFSYPHSAVLCQASGLNLAVSQIPAVEYDVQLGIAFTQDFQSLTYNVTVVAQSDAYGYGPAYLLNGVSNLGYWYQVGVVYNWPYRTRGGYNPGFNVVYEVFDSSGRSVYPVGGGGLLSFSGPVHSGDLALLNLYFSGGRVIMYVRDWNTGATASTGYSDQAATYFRGSSSVSQNRNYVFTGLMTEWYHVNPQPINEQSVAYSNYGSAISSALMLIDEWDPSNPNWSGTWAEYTSPVQYNSNPNQFQSLTSHNITVASNAYEFVTGYTGVATPVTGPFPFTLMMGVAIMVVTIIIVVDVYALLRRRRRYLEPAPPTYTPPTSEATLSHLSFCPSCGAQLSAEEKFCHNCGRPLN
jgi:hypothetical protein